MFVALTPDRPEQAGWLPVAEREALTREPRDEQRLLPDMGGYRQALRSRSVLVLSLGYLLWRS